MTYSLFNEKIAAMLIVDLHSMSIINHNCPLSIHTIEKKEKKIIILFINIDHMDIVHNHLDYECF